MHTVDIIILSYAKNDYLKGITQQAIDSLMTSEDPKLVQFNVLVIESNKDLSPYQYPQARTIYPAPKFGFHRYLNIGIKMTSNPFVCLCNNDLIFEKHWASEILRAMEQDPLLLSASPFCPRFHHERHFIRYAKPLLGYKDNQALVGWCIFVRRAIFDTIGELDERFEFWYCDWDYAKTLQHYGIRHCLISSSFVTHLSGESLRTLDSKTNEELTSKQEMYFHYKWQHRSRVRYWLSRCRFVFNSALRDLNR